MALPTGALVVFALVAVAVGLFVTELLPPDSTAIGVLVALVVLEPFTSVPAADAIAGFASPAVVTIIAMYILSEGVEAAGVVAWLGAHLGRLTRGDERRLLGSTTASTGLAAGLVNNTPVVAVFVPMVSSLAEEAGVSPSKFLIPLSYAAMLGGTLTLVGSSLNLVASSVSAQLLDHPIGMFEFTPLGLLVFGTGLAYLLTVGYRLTPPRLAPRDDVTAAYDLDRYLAQVRVRESSPLVGRTATDLFIEADLDRALDLDVLQIDRERTVVVDDAPDSAGLQTRVVRDTYIAGSGQPIEAGDVLTVRANPQTLNQFAERYGLRQYPREVVDADRLEAESHRGMLAEVVLPPESGLVDATPAEAELTERFETTVLAVRRGEEVLREGLADRPLRAGDTLLLRTTAPTIAHFREAGDVVPTEPTGADAGGTPIPDLGPRAPVSVAILLAAVLLAAGTPVPIPVTALGGVVAVVATGCLTTAEAYDAVSWNVVFLLAGILPLGVALERTGGAALLGEALGGLTAGLPPVAVLASIYLVAALAAAVITPVATIVLLGPVAVDIAETIGADGFAFVLATLFGASAAFLTPIGYQTNLMVYGPGGYRFTDFLRVGLPLLCVLTGVSTAGIVLIYGL